MGKNIPEESMLCFACEKKEKALERELEMVECSGENCHRIIQPRRAKFLDTEGVPTDKMLCIDCQAEAESFMSHSGKVHALESNRSIGACRVATSSRTLVADARR
jgi:hypothetical protein